MKILKQFDRAAIRIKNYPNDLLILRLTLILLLLYSPPYLPLKSLALPVLCAVMLVFPHFLSRRFWWAILVIVFIATNIVFWYEFDNHHYLTNYWCLVCLLAIGAKNADLIMAWNGRLLIGLCFFLATFWKLLSGEYFDGSFLEATILLDGRLEVTAYLFGGLKPETLYNNRELLDYFASTNLGESAFLTSNPQLAFFSVILSYWTLVCEGIIAIAFLCPQLKWLYDRRDYWLILFILTTYPLVSVGGFAGLLAIMGFAQSLSDRPRIGFIYLLIFISIPLWIDIPETLFVNFVL